MTLGRLARSADVRHTLRAGRRRAGTLCGVHVVDHAADRPAERAADGRGPQARLTVVASRKVGGAVRRNRAKRLLREAARTLPWRTVDVVLVARPATAAATMVTVREELARHASALGALAAAAAADEDGAVVPVEDGAAAPAAR